MTVHGVGSEKDTILNIALDFSLTAVVCVLLADNRHFVLTSTSRFSWVQMYMPTHTSGSNVS
jgi:hypothetical protein